ncbi:MAG: hypothetical protein II008_12445 [Oscillospiraceae bacterium]|nr:hypothetical protein [Oscillospiraceae bacterium]
MALTHWKKMTNPNYLGSYSLEDGQDITLTIREVRQEQVIGSDGKKEECIVCYWVEPQKPMILNVTNCKTIQKVTGSPYIEKWSGHRIQIGTEKVSAFGAVVDALRVRPYAPREEKILCESCGKEISGAGGMTAARVAAYGEKRFGKKMCAACQKAAVSAKEEASDEQTDHEAELL